MGSDMLYFYRDKRKRKQRLEKLNAERGRLPVRYLVTSGRGGVGGKWWGSMAPWKSEPYETRYTIS